MKKTTFGVGGPGERVQNPQKNKRVPKNPNHIKKKKSRGGRRLGEVWKFARIERKFL